MIIKNIEIKNWGRYPSIDIPVDVNNDKNVVLIRARNNNGKTTLFYALKWALYGDDGLLSHQRQTESIEWINRQAAADGDGEMYVELTLDLNGHEYRLQRSQKFYQTNTGERIAPDGDEILQIFDQKKGEPVTDAGNTNRTKQEWIDKYLLPKRVSQFFFFDGEDIKKYTDKPDQTVLESIVQVLGVKALQNAHQDVKDLQKIFTEDHRRKANKATKDSKLREEFSKLDEEIKNFGKELSIKINEQKDKEKRKKDLTTKLLKSQASEAKIIERSGIEDKNKDLIISLEENNTNLRNLRGDSSVMLLNGLMEIIDKTEETPSSKDQWNSKTASYMIKKHYEDCVCGTHIDENILSILKDKILQLESTPQAQVKRFVEDMFGRTNPPVLFTNLNHAMTERTRIQNEIDLNNTAILRINEELGNFSGQEEIVRLREKEEKIENEIREIISEINADTIKLNEMKDELSKMTKTLEKELPEAEIDRAENLKKFTEDIKDGFTASINNFYEQRKPKLIQHISEVFLRLINNPKLYQGLEITDQWEILVKYYDGKLLPSHKYGPSAGAQQIVATAFIAGLNAFASKSAPVVIDTPLGRLDDIHRENILKYYNKMSKAQVIILYTPTEITNDDLMLVEDNIKHHYEIIPVDQKPDLSRLVKYERVN
tara:strand:+ start:7725 stop:9698 length:1974 start_codon:yes stop_codon:yes gene_type:complete